ncbi:MAG TPA: hypothetical protein VFL82_13285, partial [Thermomicrobiales bacterium]|nr:hypothetical protein [Thermomicrobiales bacterium]
MSTTKQTAPGDEIGADWESGIIARQERQAASAIEQALRELGVEARVRDLRPVPFEGTWGVASSICHMVA